MTRRPLARLGALALLPLLLVAAACDDGTGPDTPEARTLGVVLNSVDVSLTLFDPDAPGVPRTVGLAPAGTPVAVAVRGARAAVPLGTVPAVALVDLAEGVVSATFALPGGSGATGAAFVDDTLLLVSNPGRNSVSPVNLRTGTVGPEVAVGGYPQGIHVVDGRVVVVNAELGPDFAPTGPGTLTLLDPRTLARTGAVTLSGENPGGATVGAGGRLYVVNAGRWGGPGGTLSVVDVAAGTEVAHHDGFGDFPSSVEAGPDGRLYVASYGYGVAVWDPATRAFERGPEAAVAPGGVPSSAGVGFAPDGALFALLPECQGAARALRLDAAFAVTAEVVVGTCPTDVAFTEVEGAP